MQKMFLLFGSIAMILFQGCGNGNGSSPVQQSETEQNTIIDQDTNDTQYFFKSDIMTVLSAKCLLCHGKNGNFKISSVEDTYDLLLHTSPRQTTGYGHFVIPGDVEKSLLFKKALNLDLHGGGAVLKSGSSEATLLKVWIEQGAKYQDENNRSDYTLIAWNDLGMHCMDGSDFSVFSILPPYNNLNAQLIQKNGMTNKHVSRGVTLSYIAAKDLNGKSNTTSLFDDRGNIKTNFWDYVSALFHTTLADDVGLSGNRTPSTQEENLQYHMPTARWEATGLPLTPYNNDGSKNYYPMVKVLAKDSSNRVIASTKTVLPVSDEMDCKVCHGSHNNYQPAKPSAGWENGSDINKDYKFNILRLHDEKFPTAVSDNQASLENSGYSGYSNAGLYVTAKSGTPVLCAACHKSNALPNTGIGTVKPLTQAIHSAHANVSDPIEKAKLNDSSNRSACYRCHPGATTQCLRGAMGKQPSIQCQNCHGNMNAVGQSGREGWTDEPSCQSCHQDAKRYLSAVVDIDSGTLRSAIDRRFATNTDTPIIGKSLYKYSAGHGNMQCSACHGSTHAIYPSSHEEDNIQSIDLQGHEGTVSECIVCHAQTPKTVSGGPHGMHSIGPYWVDKHQEAARNNVTQCRQCHGLEYRGTFLSKTFDKRNLIKTYKKGEMVSCYDCHNGPDGSR